MKFVNSFIFLLAATLVLTACDKDLLNKVPNDRISNDIFWKTEADAILGANAAYNNLDDLQIFFWDGISDIGHVNATTSLVAEFVRGQHTSLTPRVRAEWAARYDGIFAANTFFANIGKVQGANPQVITRLHGEVRTLRVYHYIQLASVFGDVPLITAPIDIATGKTIARTEVSKIWDFVAEELDKAVTELPVTQAEKGRITKGAALALKARAMLRANRLQQAADAAKAVIDLNTYTLYPAYKNLFTYAAESNSEVILEKGFLTGTYSHNVFQLMAPYSQKSSFTTYVPTKTYVDAFEMKNGKAITDPTSGYNPATPYANRDPRLGYSIYVQGDVLPNNTIYRPTPGSGAPDAVGSTFLATSTGFNVKKYINATDFVTPATSGLNIILLRYAEVLLTYAEAKIELNQIDASVYKAINDIRQRADVMMPVIAPGRTQAELRAIVRNERIVELGFEGLRYFDIKRWKLAENVYTGKIYGMTYTNAAGNLVTVEVPAIQRAFSGNRDYLWPIPFEEILLNSNLTQNPNY